MTARYLVADVFDGLATLETGSVDVVITSPPFLALRSYLPADHPEKRKEIGSESTPAEFLDVMFRFTAELRRVLAPHGSICVELGDTYAGTGGSGGADNLGISDRYPAGRVVPLPWTNSRLQSGGGWPLDKSKTLIPELYRIGLAYGINPLTGQESPAGKWRVRNVVTWARPNPPVGALGDKWRPATSDVVVACLSGKRYWDDLATRQAYKPGTLKQYKADGDDPLGTQRSTKGRGPKVEADGSQGMGNIMERQQLTHSGAPLLDYWEIPLDGSEAKPYGPKEKTQRISPGGSMHDHSNDEMSGLGAKGGRFLGGEWVNEAGAPLLDYWVIPPTGYSGSHYAVFPPALVVPLVQAMAPPKVCRVCGEPSRRIVDTQRISEADDSTRIKGSGNINGWSDPPENGWEYERTDRGFTDCGHDSWRPGLILDPFAGSGTTLLVATGHGHNAVGIDLDSRNADLAEARVGPFLFERVDLTQEPV